MLFVFVFSVKIPLLTEFLSLFKFAIILYMCSDTPFKLAHHVIRNVNTLWIFRGTVYPRYLGIMIQNVSKVLEKQ